MLWTWSLAAQGFKVKLGLGSGKTLRTPVTSADPTDGEKG